MKKLILILLLLSFPVMGTLYNGELNNIDNYTSCYGDIKVNVRADVGDGNYSLDNCWQITDKNYTHKCLCNGTFNVVVYVKPNITAILDIKTQYSINKTNQTNVNYYRQVTYSNLKFVNRTIVEKGFELPSLDSAFVLVPLLGGGFILIIVGIVLMFKYMFSEKLDDDEELVITKRKVEEKQPEKDNSINNDMEALLNNLDK